jgi:hypothetical protein
MRHPKSLFAVVGALTALGAAIVSASGCGSQGIGSRDRQDLDASVFDGTTATDGSIPDGDTPMSCEAQDAVEVLICTGEPTVLGYRWVGDGCEPIRCACDGADCDELFETESECMSSHPASCLPPSGCASLEFEECEASQECMLLFYGGGCINVETCSRDFDDEEAVLCWERGYACVPADHPCNQKPAAECHGDCYWREYADSFCVSEECCVEESYGYCAALDDASPDCTPQEISPCSDPCSSVTGAWWDGEFCRPILCCCEGPDCDQVYPGSTSCVAAHADCDLNACASTGGYCDYGDFVEPTCVDGYGKDHTVTQQEPDVCGLGVCCAPCPDPESPDVTYVADDPEQCAVVYYQCEPGERSFSNECGCGCIQES